MGRTSPTLRRAWPKDGPLAAICVQSVDVQCVLQFTLIHAAGCVLHRRTSRVIHRLKLFLLFFFRFKAVARPAPPTQEACEASWSRPIEKLAKMKRLRIEKQTKKARGRHPSTRPTGLFKPSPTDGRPLQKKGNESFLPPPTQGERERAAVSVGFPCRKCRRLSYPREKRARHPEQARYPTVTVFRVAGRPKRENFKPGQTLRTSTLSVSHLPSFTDDCGGRSNDPSAGSPTETLLRLLLPLNDQVRASSRPTAPPVKGGPRPIRGPH